VADFVRSSTYWQRTSEEQAAEGTAEEQETEAEASFIRKVKPTVLGQIPSNMLGFEDMRFPGVGPANDAARSFETYLWRSLNLTARIADGTTAYIRQRRSKADAAAAKKGKPSAGATGATSEGTEGRRTGAGTGEIQEEGVGGDGEELVGDVARVDGWEALDGGDGGDGGGELEEPTGNE
jgi:hypothetical protein